MHTCASEQEGNEMEEEYICGDIENVEQYLGKLFQVPVGVCIADTQDIVRNALGHEISDMRREPDPDCVTAFQYVARIEWARWNGGGAWRLMYALYRRECDHRSKLSKPVEEVERRLLLEMPIDVQRHAHHHLSQLVAAAGGEWQLLRGMMLMTHRALGKKNRSHSSARSALDAGNEQK
ncbi:MAG TPA: hypothetical protein VGF24_00845 [Vicinamibacterales bacterium]|jgi:hypothetical protein